MTIPEIISTVKDVLIGAAAVTTAIVAVIGLKNWSRELRGKSEFEAARNLMMETYRVRDELQYSRAPVVAAGEFPSDYPGPQTARAEQEAQAWSYVYKNRWEPVREALQEFETHVLEAEALWGSDIRTKADQLRQCARELQVAMESVVDDKSQRGENFETDKNFGKEMRSTAHASRGDENNELNRKIEGLQILMHLRFKRSISKWINGYTYMRGSISVSLCSTTMLIYHWSLASNGKNTRASSWSPSHSSQRGITLVATYAEFSSR